MPKADTDSPKSLRVKYLLSELDQFQYPRIIFKSAVLCYNNRISIHTLCSGVQKGRPA